VPKQRANYCPGSVARIQYRLAPLEPLGSLLLLLHPLYLSRNQVSGFS
jgi:hypothetical protein